MNNKKAQGKIGKTFTWFVGFILIVFIITILVIASMILSGSKRLTDGWDSVELQKYNSQQLVMQDKLINFLDGFSEFDGEQITIKELVIRFDKKDCDRALVRDKLIEEFRNVFSSYNECIILGAHYLQGDAKRELIDIRLSNGYSQSFFDNYHESLLDEGILFHIFLEDKNIQIKFYFGDC